MSCPRVFIGRVDSTVSDSDLFQFLNRYCSPRWVKIVCEPDGQSKGFAFAEMPDEAELKLALGIDGVPFKGRYLIVEQAKTKVRVNDESNL